MEFGLTGVVMEKLNEKFGIAVTRNEVAAMTKLPAATNDEVYALPFLDKDNIFSVFIVIVSRYPNNSLESIRASKVSNFIRV